LLIGNRRRLVTDKKNNLNNIILLLSIVTFQNLIGKPDRFTVYYQYKTSLEFNQNHTEKITGELVATGNETTSMIHYIDITTDQNRAGNISYNFNLPDTNLYEKSAWFKIINNKKIRLPFDKIKIIKTADTKIILNYKCRKYLLKQDSNTAICYVSKDLPSTLMPFGGMKLLEGAILEYYVNGVNVSYVATSIRKEE
jgi:hypothetical protein